LAVTAVAVFLAASGAAVYVVMRDYAPKALAQRAQAAVREATGLDVTLLKPKISVERTITFARASVSVGGKEILKAGPVTIDGLPEPGGQWRPKGIEVRDITALVDLWNGPKAIEAVSAFATLADKAASIKVTLPAEANVVVRCPGCEGEELVAPVNTFLEKRVLELATRGREPGHLNFTMGAGEITLAAPLRNDDESPAQGIARAARTAVIGDARGGALAARWGADGETATFTNEDGWSVEASVAEAAGIHAEGGKLGIIITSFNVKNGAVDAMAGTFKYSAAVLESKTLSRWLGAIGLPEISGRSVPARFENVSIAGEFEVSGGMVSVKPAAGRPGLAWSEVGEQKIVLANGEGRGKVDTVIAALGEAKAQ
jgi:hypothetical protein